MAGARTRFLVFFVLFFAEAHGQQKTFEQVMAMPEDTAKLRALYEIFPSAMNKSFARADTVIETISRLAQQFDSDLGRARASYYRGWYLQRAKKYEESIPWLMKAGDLFRLVKNNRMVQVNNQMLGISYYRSRKFSTSDSILVSVMKYAEQAKDDELLGAVYHTLSVSHRQRGNIEEALHYALDAASIREKTNELEHLATDYNSIALNLKDQKRYQEEIVYYEKGIRLATQLKNDYQLALLYSNLAVAYKNMEDYDNSMKYFQKARIYDAASGFTQTSLIYSGMSTLFNRMKLQDSAFYYARKALALDIGKRDYRSMAVVNFNLAQWYFDAKDYVRCAQHLDSAEAQATRAFHKELLAVIYKLEADLDEKNNQLKAAYDNLKKSTAIRDSMYSIQNMKQMGELLTKYETEKKDRELAQNKVKIQAGEMEIARKTNANRLLAAGLVGLVLVLAIAFVAFLQRQKLLAERKEAE